MLAGRRPRLSPPLSADCSESGRLFGIAWPMPVASPVGLGTGVAQTVPLQSFDYGSGNVTRSAATGRSADRVSRESGRGRRRTRRPASNPVAGGLETDAE